MNNSKYLLGIILSIGFIIIGIYQTQSERIFAQNLGYILIVYWSAILLFALYKKITTKKTNN